MLPYWLLFILPAFKALESPKERWNNQTSIAIIFILSLFIGLRHEVGRDWGNYLHYLSFVRGTDLFEGKAGKELLFFMISKLSLFFNFGVYGINFFSAVIFSSGLIYFCRSLTRQWLALTISIPYIVIAVGMGYTRQSISLGILMIGIVFLSKGKKLVFLALTIFNSFLQLTGLISLFLLIPYLFRIRKLVNKAVYFVVSLLLFRVFYSIFISKYLIYYIYVYFEQGLSSSGVYIRLFLVCFPSIIFLFSGHKLSLNENEKIIWKTIAYFSLLLIPLVFILPSTTAIDRLALYALPIMVFTFSSIPELKFVRINKTILNCLVVTFSFAIQFVWLNFASNAFAWLPYQNILFRLN